MGGMVTFQADVADYDPADLGDLVGGVGWTVDSSRVAVLVHDMLPYYLQVLLSGVKPGFCMRLRRLPSGRWAVTFRLWSAVLDLQITPPREVSADCFGVKGRPPMRRSRSRFRRSHREVSRGSEAFLQRLLWHRLGDRTSPNWPRPTAGGRSVRQRRGTCHRLRRAGPGYRTLRCFRGGSGLHGRQAPGGFRTDRRGYRTGHRA